MNESNRPDLLRVVVDRLIGHAEGILRTAGTPPQRGRAFSAQLADAGVIEILGHGHPLIVEAEAAYVGTSVLEMSEDQGIRAALAVLVAARQALPPLERPADPAGSAERRRLVQPQLKVVGVARGRLYISVPQSWGAPFAWVWRNLVAQPAVAAWRVRLPWLPALVGRLLLLIILPVTVGLIILYLGTRFDWLQ